MGKLWSILVAVYLTLATLLGGPVGVGTAAAPQQAGGAISGTITYAGSVTGTHQVLVWVYTSFTEEEPAYTLTIAGPGPYTVPNVADGTYYLLAFLDANDNGQVDYYQDYQDPDGYYGSPGAPQTVTISEASQATGIDFAIYDPAPQGEGSISGTVSYQGSVTGVHLIQVYVRTSLEAPPRYFAEINGPGPYTLSNLPDGSYYVAAMLDANDNGTLDPNDPWGAWGTPQMELVTISGGGQVTGIDIPIRDAVVRRLAPIADQLAMAYSYQATDAADPWKLYDPAAPPFANDLTALEPGKGYWIKVTADCSLGNLSLLSGWNLIAWTG